MSERDTQSQQGLSDDEDQSMSVQDDNKPSYQFESAYGDTSFSPGDSEMPIRRGRGRPRKYPPGTTAYDMLKARRAVESQQVVIPMKEYGLRLRRELRSSGSVAERRDYEAPQYVPPVRGTLRALMDRDPEFAHMPQKYLVGVKFAQLKPVISTEPVEGPRRPRGRPRKLKADDQQDPGEDGEEEDQEEEPQQPLLGIMLD